MCGIAGIISPNPANVTPTRLQQMTDAIKHRGPDGEGQWIGHEGAVGFGHRRLSIIDLSAAGHQPMHYANRYTITYNGELYNYVELKKVLQLKGFLFNSHTDTEVILAAYAHYGNDCLKHFDGMFAFALWDSHTHTLFCARDRFGEKPLYYAYPKNQFIFASEMKALWAIGHPKAINNNMLANYLALGLTNDPLDHYETFYKNTFSLPAGHYLQLTIQPNATANPFNIIIQSYWDLDSEKIIATSTSDASATFYNLLQTSVQRRMRSDVSLGTSLSGGLDSSAIVAMMSKQSAGASNYQQATFSATFPGFKNNESKYIDEVNTVFNLKGHYVSPTAADMASDFEKVAWHQEEPFQSASIFAQYKVYQLAKQQGVTVLLDGQGADETMAGYHQYFHWYWQELLAAFEWKQLKQEIKAARNNGVTDGWNVKNYLAAFMPASTARQLQKKAEYQLQQPFLHPDLLSIAKKHPIYKPTVSHLNQLLYFNTRQLGLGALLGYADRNSMAHGVEVRLPFLSHDLVSFIFSLPSNFKIRHGFTKWILRSATEDHLPKNIVWRKDKVGFEPPQQQWLQHPKMIERIHESRKQLVTMGILNNHVLKTPLQTADAHHANNNDWRYLCAAACLKSSEF